ncbi:hypothetical protein ABIB75_003646 [Bradyrhizobium sp. GM2.2]
MSLLVGRNERRHTECDYACSSQGPERYSDLFGHGRGLLTKAASPLLPDGPRAHTDQHCVGKPTPSQVHQERACGIPVFYAVSFQSSLHYRVHAGCLAPLVLGQCARRRPKLLQARFDDSKFVLNGLNGVRGIDTRDGLQLAPASCADARAIVRERVDPCPAHNLRQSTPWLLTFRIISAANHWCKQTPAKPSCVVGTDLPPAGRAAAASVLRRIHHKRSLPVRRPFSLTLKIQPGIAIAVV